MSRYSGFSAPEQPPLTRQQARARARELARTTTCDTCGGELVVFEVIDGEPTRWTHAGNMPETSYRQEFHYPLPANETGD